MLLVVVSHGLGKGMHTRNGKPPGICPPRPPLQAPTAEELAARARDAAREAERRKRDAEKRKRDAERIR